MLFLDTRTFILSMNRRLKCIAKTHPRIICFVIRRKINFWQSYVWMSALSIVKVDHNNGSMQCDSYCMIFKDFSRTSHNCVIVVLNFPFAILIAWDLPFLLLEGKDVYRMIRYKCYLLDADDALLMMNDCCRFGWYWTCTLLISILATPRPS